jgi:DNA-binding NarL/FixJ family response regulator
MGTSGTAPNDRSLERLIRRGDLLFDESREAMRHAVMLRLQGEYIRNRVEGGRSATDKPQKRENAAQPVLTSLTPREHTVLQLVVKGKSTREIAGLLRISFKTAACHRSAIMNKLDVHKSALLVREAYRLGLVQE